MQRVERPAMRQCYIHSLRMILNRWERESNKHSISNCSGRVVASSCKKRGLKSLWVCEICRINLYSILDIISLYSCFFNQGCNCIHNLYPKIFPFNTDSLHHLFPYLILIIISLILFIGRKKYIKVKKKFWPESVIRFNSLNLMYANCIEDIVYSGITLSLLKMKSCFLQTAFCHSV